MLGDYESLIKQTLDLCDHKVELSGVTIPTNGHNKCHISDCKNDACTSVWIKSPYHKDSKIQCDVCGWHLKENIESGNWKVKK